MIEQWRCRTNPLDKFRLSSLGAVDHGAVERLTELFVGRGQLESVEGGAQAAVVCLGRARERLKAAQVLSDSGLWESSYTAAYDAYRTAADATVLSLGLRVPAVAGAHRITGDVAHAALGDVTDAYAPASAEQIRQGRHESEYFDPARPIDKSPGDAAWALDLAARAVGVVEVFLAGG